MKNYLFVCLFLSFSNSIFSQTMLKYIESEVENMLRQDAQSWKASEYIYNSVRVNDAREDGDRLILEGTFIVRITQWPFKGKRSINFKAEAKQILDDITVKRIWWVQPITNLDWCVGSCY